MRRIESVFGEGRKALVVYLTAGFPRPGLDEALALAALESGADVLELGFPFSDPVADGPLIQAASKKALENGMTLAGTIELAGRIRKKGDAPILLMGYANPVFSMGYERFARQAALAGVDGAIIPDLPIEEAAPLREPMRGRGLALIPMAAPTTSPERLSRVLGEGDGFLYLVSMTGITGDAFSADAPWRRLADAARADGRLPVCVGFGISSGGDAAAAAPAVDGVIVGSAVTKVIMEAADDADAVRRVSALVGELKGCLGGVGG